jgi:hypothetical protein
MIIREKLVGLYNVVEFTQYPSPNNEKTLKRFVENIIELTRSLEQIAKGNTRVHHYYHENLAKIINAELLQLQYLTKHPQYLESMSFISYIKKGIRTAFDLFIMYCDIVDEGILDEVVD